MSSRRAAIDSIFHQGLRARQANIGLWLDKYLPDQGRPQRNADTSGTDVAAKAAHIQQAAEIEEPRSYMLFFNSWQQALSKRPGIDMRRASVQGRLVVGLGAESVLETAILLHHSYGMPYIPGSALKGLAAAFAHQQLVEDTWRKASQDKPIGEAHRTMFGDQSSAGYVRFHDALYIPKSGFKGRALYPDVIAVHHPGYYQGTGDPPADWDSPVPIPFLSATGRYMLALEGPLAWVHKAYDILGLALAEMGIGAKTSSGYGRLQIEGSAAQSAATSRTREVGEVFTGLVIERDAENVLIQIPGVDLSVGLGMLPVDSTTPQWKEGHDKARVEIIAVEKRGNRTILRLKRASK